MDPLTGALGASTGHYEKRLSDLEGLYQDQQAFERALRADGDRVVYSVHDVRPAQQSGDLIFGTTHMEPGRIGDEFFMTRGHIHATGNRPETYYGEAGEGLMLMEAPDGTISILEVHPKVMVYVPPFWIHRSVNTGTTPLVMSFCYPSDSGQDYEVIAKSGGMAVRIVADGAGWKDVPNASYRPRTASEIDAIFATRS
ncbi:MAG: glucose-6-phosphate isomerase [Pseudomonadota bacterium]